MELLVRLIYLASLLAVGEPHGYMIEPPMRSSMWRVYPGFPPNYNDMELFCGGVTKQWDEMDGKCGTCGDAYDAEVRENEAGGMYATGAIGRNYTRGQVIKVGIQLTASHLGNFQFKICPHNNPTVRVSQECLDQHRLNLAGTDEHHFYPKDTGFYEIELQLPEDMVCSQCILQWHYTAGNTWGCTEDGDCCLGCASKQETFINCADVTIFDNDETVPSTSAPSTEKPTTKAPETNAPTTPAPTNAPTTQAPTTPAPTTQAPTTQAPTEAPTTTLPTHETTSAESVLMDCPPDYTLMCDGVGDLAGDLTRQQFCNDHCRKKTSTCTSEFCTCTCQKISCKSIGPFEGSRTHDDWCQMMCTQDFNGCPELSSECECTEDA
ncbi:uncharacterized protein LOC134270057 [Saccostrea cucullata]|uniref:uncharacterized protein LOC134270057 n=1 Tax=Saccostrea cuccullata TaxID=36930 RepID=UPI002ED0166D